MQEKIIQIIPAPQGMTAYYEDGACVDGKCIHRRSERHTAHGVPVACIALVEVTDADGTYTEIRPMTMMHEGYGDFADDSSNFVGIDYE